MSSYAGFTQMGSQPVAGRARAMHACVTGRSMVSAHLAWLADFQAKPATARIAVPDTNGTRRSRGTP